MKVTLRVEGMSCQGCVRSVQGIISKGLEVEREAVAVELEPGRAEFEAPEGFEVGRIVEALRAKGFSAAEEGSGGR
jgi:copper chaperone CopZ